MRIKVWDLPTRLFHWTLFVAVTISLLTGLQGGNWMVWHERTGLLVLGLLTFRLIWGVLGSTYARFAQFFPTPRSLLAYLRGHWHGEGHSPLGALSVFALLLVLLFQAGSGLFSTDDIVFDGPLHDLVSSDLSQELEEVVAAEGSCCGTGVAKLKWHRSQFLGSSQIPRFYAIARAVCVSVGTLRAGRFGRWVRSTTLRLFAERGAEIRACQSPFSR
jgi:cytochrome b